MSRRAYRVNADMWTVLKDILVGTPEEFNPNAATMRGRWESQPMQGKLLGNVPDSTTFRGHRAAGAIDYVIYSYNTPIAYRISVMVLGQPITRWVVPNVKYSVTTSKHQGKVRTALSQITGGYTE